MGVPVDKPVVGAVAGWVVGGAMVLTTMCDILVAADNTRFSYPEVKVGFTGGIITNLASRIPHKIAMEMLLVGEPIDAKRAYEVGYVNKVVPVAELMPAAWTMPAHRCHRAAALACTQALRRRSAAQGPDRDRRHRPGPNRHHLRQPGLGRGRKAFTEKRPPNYKGR